MREATVAAGTRLDGQLRRVGSGVHERAALSSRGCNAARMRSSREASAFNSLLIGFAVAASAMGACGEDGRRGAPAPQMNAQDASMNDAGPRDAGPDGGSTDAGSALGRCEGDAGTAVAGIASIALNGAPPLKLAETAQLTGDGLLRTLAPQQGVAAGLRWEGDRLFMLTDTGFWDISVAGDARWYPTASVLLLSLRAADLDGDGDHDLLLLTADVNADAASDPSASPLVTRLAAWERTADGLVERSEVLRFPYVTLPTPYETGDLDGDGDLDVPAYERGAPVGYMSDGAFGFTREVLGETAPEYEDKLLGMVRYGDRNRDGAPDLVVMTGEALEISVFVLLGDGTGRFGAPGPATIVEAPLVPHGPAAMGMWIDDVTGDGLDDVVTQDAQSPASGGTLNLFASEDATRIAAARQLEGLGFELADVDTDGNTDIVTTRADRLTALLSRADGAFEARELGVSAARPVLDFVAGFDPAGAPALHLLYDLSACPSCAGGCAGSCLFDACVSGP